MWEYLTIRSILPIYLWLEESVSIFIWLRFFLCCSNTCWFSSFHIIYYNHLECSFPALSHRFIFEFLFELRLDVTWHVSYWSPSKSEQRCWYHTNSLETESLYFGVFLGWANGLQLPIWMDVIADGGCALLTQTDLTPQENRGLVMDAIHR